MQYIDVMIAAITYKYDIGKIKLELNHNSEIRFLFGKRGFIRLE